MRWPAIFLEKVQQTGTRIGAYRNVMWLVIVLAGFAYGTYRFATGMGTVLPGAVLILVVSAGLLVVVLIVYRRVSGPGYRWVSAEYVYRFDAVDLRKQTQDIRITIKARRDNVCCFENSYGWSGAGDSAVRVVSPGHRFVGEVPADEWRRLYWVHLDTPLNRGDTAEIHVRQNLFDDRRNLRPILTKRISEPLDALTLKVVFPRSAAPPTVEARETVYAKKAPHWRAVQMDVPHWGGDSTQAEVSYSPPRPRLRRRYELAWEPWNVYRKSGETS